MQIMKSIFAILSSLFIIILWGNVAVAQPIGSEITFINDTPLFDDAGLSSLTAEVPVVLATAEGNDIGQRMAIDTEGNAFVLWSNRGGSHQLSGIDSEGQRLQPIFGDQSMPDQMLDINLESITKWNICEADLNSGNVLIGATYLASDIANSSASIPISVTDAINLREDNINGHGFFMLYDNAMQPLLDQPVSVGQFSAGHVEWDACWLNDGKFVIATTVQGHPYEEDPDYPDGGTHVVTVNIFNADGSRFSDEFFIDDLSGEQRDISVGALSNGFVCVYLDDDSRVEGEALYKGIVFDFKGDKTSEFTVSDTENEIMTVDAMDAGGGDQFVTLHMFDGSAEIGLPQEMQGMTVLLAQRWNTAGERVGPYIIVSQHTDFRIVESPYCAVARNNTFVAAWIDGNADIFDFTSSVVGRIFHADGMPASDAFVVHPIPEFTDPDTGFSTGGGDPVQPVCAATGDVFAFAWGSTALPGSISTDLVMSAFENPATRILDWSVY